MAKTKQLGKPAKVIKPRKPGKPGKLLRNTFEGYSDPQRSRSKINSFSNLDIATDMITAGDSVGGGIMQAVPNFDDPQVIPIDPVITDPIGMRATIESNGNLNYTNTNVVSVSTLPDAPALDTNDLAVEDAGIDAEGSLEGPAGSPAQLGGQATEDTYATPSVTDKGAKTRNTILYIILAILVLIALVYAFKKMK